MSRRTFLRRLTLAPFAFSFLGAGTTFASVNKGSIKPPSLKKGDTIGLINPSGAIYETEPYEIAVEAMKALGFNVKMGAHAHDRYGHLAGKDEDRASEINEMFRDPGVNGIFCLRGGSGAARILDMLDYKAIARNPKVFLGYSDITAFLLAIYSKTGLITFHGPVATSTWEEFSLKYFKEVLMEGKAPEFSNPGKKDDELVQTEDRIRTINPGKASGVIVGGNLSVLTGLMGSQYLPDWKGKILFVEDIREKIHRVDRMMSQLKLAGALDQLSGFIFGKCTKCDRVDEYGSLTLEEVIDHYIKPLNIPAFSGAMIGHIEKKFTIPIGVDATMDANQGTIKLNEAAVI